MREETDGEEGGKAAKEGRQGGDGKSRPLVISRSRRLFSTQQLHLSKLKTG